MDDQGPETKLPSLVKARSTIAWILPVLAYFSLLAGVVAVCWWASLAIVASQAETKARKYERLLPRELGTKALLYAGDDSTLANYILPIPLDVCGGALFQLSAETLAKIDKEGLRFLSRTTYPRLPSPEGTPAVQQTYRAWSETPIPAEWHGDGLLGFGFQCMDLPNDVTHAIDQAARMPGSFYSESDQSLLLVVPSLGAVMFAFFE